MTQRHHRYAVTVEVTVTNPKLAIQAARDSAASTGNPRSAIKNTRDAVHWLLDPGSMFESGIEVDGSLIREDWHE